jgi:hypothetical protein
MSEDDVHIYDLNEINCIIDNNDYHKFYDFNDHTVYYKMRLLHNMLDDRKGSLSSSEFVINESIKLLLSGQIPQPIIAIQRIIEQDNAKRKQDGFKRDIVDPKVRSVCETLGIPEEAVKYGFPSVKPMKMRLFHLPEETLADDVREEAVRIVYPDRIGFFVEDKSTILSPLASKQLQCFYLFVNPIILRKNGINEDKVRSIFKQEINTDLLFL